MKRTASAHWAGNLKEGKGHLSTQSTILNQTQYSFTTRFENGAGTNPEELIAAAHAGCFTMALSAALGRNGITPESLDTEATVEVDMPTLSITHIGLKLVAKVPGISLETFNEIAQSAKENCIVSKALKVSISLESTLL